MMKSDTHYDVIVLGAGPAGLTAGIYLSRARIRTLIINEGTVGGQMVLTHEIANYPGVETTSGYQLSGIMKKQARSFGCDIVGNASLRELMLEGPVKMVRLSDGREYSASAIILAPGGRPRQLGVPGEETFRGKGISYCATCDGDFFTGKEIIVVGGGNSALEEAVSLTKYASRVTIVHQFDHFQAFEYAIEEARNNPSIRFILSSTIAAFHGNEKLQSVDIKNLLTGELHNMPIDGVFVFIGYVPNTEFLRGKLNLNEYGEILVNANMETGINGVFAAGDAVAKRFRQITTAVGDGTVAALAAAQYVYTFRQQKQAEAVKIN